MSEQESFNLVDAIADLNAYDFTYKPKAEGLPGVDEKEHVGVLAQELASNPVTDSAVTDIAGYLAIDVAELSTINLAVLTAVCKKLQELERKVGQSGLAAE